VVVVRGVQYLTKKNQYEAVYHSRNYRAGRELVIRILPNGLDISRYGITVSRHVGKAVVRNKIKRRFREILRKITLRPGFDIVIIARASAARADYSEMKKTTENLLFRAGLLVGEYEGSSSSTD
jgi:ribonuclease P protein component